MAYSKAVLLALIAMTLVICSEVSAHQLDKSSTTEKLHSVEESKYGRSRGYGGHGGVGYGGGGYGHGGHGGRYPPKVEENKDQKNEAVDILDDCYGDYCHSGGYGGYYPPSPTTKTVEKQIKV
ncbi:dormancy-associated protein 2-like [Chenopodium quinoa]|uniref:dormancy-associated protein 2-like n=1 Tax=Chenopodium quinoa TaxID=63459 RepID=UPI000B76FD3D|nr:dormancy-associated protein 2-like [Chenopodium quinoa]